MGYELDHLRMIYSAVGVTLACTLVKGRDPSGYLVFFFYIEIFVPCVLSFLTWLSNQLTATYITHAHTMSLKEIFPVLADSGFPEGFDP